MFAALSEWIGQLFGVNQLGADLTVFFLALLIFAVTGYVSLLVFILRLIGAFVIDDFQPDSGLAEWLKNEVNLKEDSIKIAMILVVGCVAFFCMRVIDPENAMRFVIPGLVFFGYTYALHHNSTDS